MLCFQRSLFDKYRTVRIIRRDVFGTLAREKLWHEKTVREENDSAYMIYDFLAYRYVCYVKTTILLKYSTLLL